MMFSPSVTTTFTPMISIITGVTFQPVLTYNQILQSLGVNVYGAEFIYVYGDTYTQISQPMTYNHFDSNGNSITSILPFSVDPYQSQTAKYYETNPDEVVLDGFSSLAFNLSPNSTLYFKMFALVNSNSLYLDETNLNAFQEYELREVKFFDDFCNYLIDKEDATQT